MFDGTIDLAWRADQFVFHDVNARIAELYAPGLFWQGTLPGEGPCSKPRAMRLWLRRQASAFEKRERFDFAQGKLAPAL